MDFVISPYWFMSYSRFPNRLLLFNPSAHGTDTP